MKKVLILLLCLFFGGIFSFRDVVAQSADNSPFIYYYSFENSAFIVERADGSERRILAKFQLPDTHMRIEGAGWSSSGKWFAWTSEAPGGTLTPNMNVYIVGRDGHEQISLLNQFGEGTRVPKMVWSPMEDLLLFDYTYIDVSTRDSAPEKIVIYDPESKHSVLEFESPFGRFLRINWSPDGKSIEAFDGNVYVLSLDNQPLNNIAPIASQTDGAEMCSDLGSLPHWIAPYTLAYLYPKSTDLVITNLKSQTSMRIALPDGVVEHVDWSLDGSYAITYLARSEDDFTPELWLISSAGDKQLLAEDVRFDNNCNAPFDQSAWNKNNQAFFITSDGQLHILSADTGHISSIKLPNSDEVLRLSPIKWTQDELLFIGSDTNNNSKIYSYRIKTDKAKVLIPKNENQATYTDFFSFASSNILFYNNAGTGKVANLMTGDETSIEFIADPKYGSSMGISSGIWYPDGNWLFLTSDSSEYLHLINVVQSDGSDQRQLSLCRLASKTCFGWLPPLAG